MNQKKRENFFDGFQEQGLDIPIYMKNRSKLIDPFEKIKKEIVKAIEVFKDKLCTIIKDTKI